MQGASPLASPALNRLRHLQTLPNRCPAAEAGRRWDGASLAPGGGLPPTLPVDPAAVVFAGVACLFGCLPALPLVFDSAPIPQPPSPAGKGEPLRLFCRGLPPPAPRHLTVCGIYRLCQTGVRRLKPGGAGLGRLPHPAGACPRRCRLTLPLWCSQGWLAFLVACLPCLWFAFLPPIPPAPFPGGEGGDSKIILPGATAPGTPGIKPLAAQAEPEKQAPGEGLPPGVAG